MISSPVESRCCRLQHLLIFSKRMMVFINLIQTRTTFSSVGRGCKYRTPTGIKEGTSARKQLNVSTLLPMFSGSLICILETPVVFRMLLTFRIMQCIIVRPKQ